MRVIWVDNDTTFEVNHLRNTLFDEGGETDDTASVQLTLTELDGTPVAGEAWPKVLQGVGNGRYVNQVGSAAQLVAETFYNAIFDITGSNGETAKWELLVEAKKRVA